MDVEEPEVVPTFQIRVAEISSEGSYHNGDTESFEEWIREAFAAEFGPDNTTRIHSRIITLGGQTAVLKTLNFCQGESDHCRYLFIAFRGTYDREDVRIDLKMRPKKYPISF